MCRLGTVNHHSTPISMRLAGHHSATSFGIRLRHWAALRYLSAQGAPLLFVRTGTQDHGNIPSRCPGSWTTPLSLNRVLLCGKGQVFTAMHWLPRPEWHYGQEPLPFPLISRAFKQLQGATVFTKLDFRNHLVCIGEGGEWKIAFNTLVGCYKYLVMTFWLTNATTVFQNLVNNVLWDTLNCFVFVYIDDILIFSRSLEDHVMYARAIVQCLLEHSLYVKAEMCDFHVTSFSDLGYIFAAGIFAWTSQRSQLCLTGHFLTHRSSCNYSWGLSTFRVRVRFVRNYISMAALLTALTSSKRVFVWSPETESGFGKLKTSFTSTPILQMPDPERQFVFMVDTLDVGRVVVQRSSSDQKLHPCAFFSCRLTPLECNYSIGNLELLEFKLTLEEWRHWLEGANLPFLVWTDDKNLEYIKSAKKLNSRRDRLALIFTRFDFSLASFPGSRNVKPDSVFRQFAIEEDSTRNPEPILPPTLMCSNLYRSPIVSGHISPRTSSQGCPASSGIQSS